MQGRRSFAEDNDDDNDGVLDGNDNCPIGILGWTSDSANDTDQDGCRDIDEDDFVADCYNGVAELFISQTPTSKMREER